MNLTSLAHEATEALLAQKPVTVKHPPNWQRDGFPLPMVRQKPAVDGSVTQQYRPLAILEYVNDKLINEKAGERMAEWHAKEKPASGSDLFADPAPAVDLFGGAAALGNLFAAPAPAVNLFG